MIIKKIKLKNYRNYNSVVLKLNPYMNIFIGNNAQGKTNILESIYFLALTKSHRAFLERDLIRFHQTKATVSALIQDNKIYKDLQIELTQEEKKLKLNDTEIKKIAEYISNLNVIIFTPDDLEIIKGSPSIRRNLLNIQISQLSKEYLKILNEYNKILKTRNEYLKILFTNHLSDTRYLDVLTDQLIEKAIIIYRHRSLYIEKINKQIDSIFSKITGEKGIKIVYEDNIELTSYEAEEIRLKLSSKLRKNYQRELTQGMTLYGPHRDDFSYQLHGNSLKLYGSQGQQRLAIISHKLSEIELFKEYTDTNPVLLLDDIFSEIDRKKKNKLLEYINTDIQSIITTTDLKDIQKKYLNNAKVFLVEAGNVTEKEG